MADYRVNWYTDQVMALVNQAVDIEAMAHRIEERTKGNIVENDQVDTGFMLNSVYVITDAKSGYSAAQATATALNPQAMMLPPPPLGKADAAVVVGAEYAIYQELNRSFLFRALDEAKADASSLVIKKL
jgi:hypothetical protein